MNSNRFLIYIFFTGIVLLIVGLIFIKIEIKSTSIGVVQYKNETIVYSSADGRIEQVYREPGELVAKGDKILTLFNPDLEVRLNELEQEIIKLKHQLNDLSFRNHELKIVGVLPEMQDIEAVVTIRKEIGEVYKKIEESNQISLERNLISERQYYREKIQESENEMLRISYDRLLRWKSQGYAKLKQEKNIADQDYVSLLLKKIENKRDILLQEKNSLTIIAPFDGVLVDHYFEYASQQINKGESLVKIADSGSGFQVKAYIPERNIDLVKDKMTVRMKSLVFNSKLEGYLMGEVNRVTNQRDIFTPEDTENAYFEVLVDIVSYPYPPAHGSRVELEIILGKGNLISAMIKRPLRNTSEEQRSY